MSLTPEQKQALSTWVAAGDNLSAIQKKLTEQFKLSLTYMDVRFLVDDLNLELKDAAPRANANDVSKTPPPRPAPPAEKSAGRAPPAQEPAKTKLSLNKDAATPAPADDEIADAAGEFTDEEDGIYPEEQPAGLAGNVSVTVDAVTLTPGAMASGTVTFGDGVTGKWIVDNYGRPGFTEISQPGYRPSPADAQAFMQELSAALQKRGF